MGLVDDMMARAWRGVKLLREQSREAAEQMRLRVEKAKLQREQAEMFQKLGQHVYALHRQGLEPHPSCEPFVIELERLEGAIAEKRAALSEQAFVTEPQDGPKGNR